MCTEANVDGSDSCTFCGKRRDEVKDTIHERRRAEEIVGKAYSDDRLGMDSLEWIAIITSFDVADGFDRSNEPGIWHAQSDDGELHSLSLKDLKQNEVELYRWVHLICLVCCFELCTLL